MSFLPGTAEPNHNRPILCPDTMALCFTDDQKDECPGRHHRKTRPILYISFVKISQKSPAGVPQK